MSVSRRRELRLFDEFLVTEKRMSVKDPANYIPSTSKISAMRHYTAAEERNEKLMGVSTKLTLYDPFKIKKNLTGSDIGNLSRLLINTNLVKNHILPFFNPNAVNKIESDAGLRVKVWDQDTDSEHHLVFKQWGTSKSYVFIGNWVKDFVQRRVLQEGDEIGLYWDSCQGRFTFSLLKQAPSN